MVEMMSCHEVRLAAESIGGAAVGALGEFGLKEVGKTEDGIFFRHRLGELGVELARVFMVTGFAVVKRVEQEHVGYIQPTPFGTGIGTKPFGDDGTRGMGSASNASDMLAEDVAETAEDSDKPLDGMETKSPTLGIFVEATAEYMTSITVDRYLREPETKESDLYFYRFGDNVAPMINLYHAAYLARNVFMNGARVLMRASLPIVLGKPRSTRDIATALGNGAENVPEVTRSMPTILDQRRKLIQAHLTELEEKVASAGLFNAVPMTHYRVNVDGADETQIVAQPQMQQQAVATAIYATKRIQSATMVTLPEEQTRFRTDRARLALEAQSRNAWLRRAAESILFALCDLCRVQITEQMIEAAYQTVQLKVQLEPEDMRSLVENVVKGTTVDEVLYHREDLSVEQKSGILEDIMVHGHADVPPPPEKEQAAKRPRK